MKQTGLLQDWIDRVHSGMKPMRVTRLIYKGADNDQEGLTDTTRVARSMTSRDRIGKLQILTTERREKVKKKKNAPRPPADSKRSKPKQTLWLSIKATTED